MLRHRLTVVVAVLLAAGTGGCGSDTANPSAGPAGTAAASQAHGSPSVTVSATLGRQLNDAHAATAKYATDLSAAQRDGYMIITPMMPGMGFHYLNPKVTGFDTSKPAILRPLLASIMKLGWRKHVDDDPRFMIGAVRRVTGPGGATSRRPRAASRR